MRVREGEAYLCLQVAGGKEAAVGGRREGGCCWGPAGRSLLLGAGGEEAAPGMQGRSSSSCWFLTSQPPIELRGAGVAGIAGIQSLPGSIELRTTRLRCGVPESVGEKRRAGKGGTAAGGGRRLWFQVRWR